eukprot:3287271-Rhodomonas_salina.2
MHIHVHSSSPPNHMPLPRLSAPCMSRRSKVFENLRPFSSGADAVTVFPSVLQRCGLLPCHGCLGTFLGCVICCYGRDPMTDPPFRCRCAHVTSESHGLARSLRLTASS